MPPQRRSHRLEAQNTNAASNIAMQAAGAGATKTIRKRKPKVKKYPLEGQEKVPSHGDSTGFNVFLRGREGENTFKAFDVKRYRKKGKLWSEGFIVVTPGPFEIMIEQSFSLNYTYQRNDYNIRICVDGQRIRDTIHLRKSLREQDMNAFVIDHIWTEVNGIIEKRPLLFEPVAKTSSTERITAGTKNPAKIGIIEILLCRGKAEQGEDNRCNTVKWNPCILQESETIVEYAVGAGEAEALEEDEKHYTFVPVHKKEDDDAFYAWIFHYGTLEALEAYMKGDRTTSPVPPRPNSGDPSEVHAAQVDPGADNTSLPQEEATPEDLWGSDVSDTLDSDSALTHTEGDSIIDQNGCQEIVDVPFTSTSAQDSAHRMDAEEQSVETADGGGEETQMILDENPICLSQLEAEVAQTFQDIGTSRGSPSQVQVDLAQAQVNLARAQVNLAHVQASLAQVQVDLAQSMALSKIRQDD